MNARTLRTLLSLAVLALVALAGMADRARASGCIYFSYLKGCTQANCTCPDGSYKWDREQFAIRCDDGVVDEDEDLGSCWATPALNTWNSYVNANWTASCGASWSGSLDLCGSSPAPNDCRLPDNSKMSCVGDPVDLATGSLEQTATDLDLAKGLAFRRHYASDTPASVATRLGKNWRHGFEWGLQFEIAQVAAGSDPLVETVLVRPPFAKPAAFLRTTSGATAGAWVPSARGVGGLTSSSDLSELWYTDASGARVRFDRTATAPATYAVARIQLPAEAEIAISSSQSGSTTTTMYARAGSCLVVLETAGRITSVESRSGADCATAPVDQAWTYTYSSDGEDCLVGASGPFPPDPTKPVAFTYVYELTPQGTCTGRLVRVDRKVGSAPTDPTITIGAWEFAGTRVAVIEEQSLAQDLFVTYGVGAQLTAIVRDAPGTSGDPLATFISREGRIETVSGTGSPDVSIPFSTATFTSASGDAPANLWKTTTSVRAVGDEIKTLYENHDALGRPGRVTEGWRDADDDDQLDAGETFLRRRDSTHHPRLDALLSVAETSVLHSAGSRLLTRDYDSDLDATANEAPTDRVYRQSLQGWTLSADGAQVAFSDETASAYDAAGRLTSVDGPRAAQRTEIDYDPVSGSRSALRRYVGGAGSAFLQWSFSNFDARGNPQVVTDPNLRVTEFTYDGLGRVSTAKPPYEGSGDSTVIFTYDIDGNLTRVQFPDDAYGADVFLRLGYDPQKPDLLTFLADSQGNAIVYAYDRGRVDREERYTGFVDLANKGTRVGDATFDHDTAGNLVKAFNPLFAGGSVATTFEYDAKGNPKKVVDENQKQDELLYDALDRLEKIKQIRTATYETTFAYDALSDVTRVTDAAGRATDLLHDDRGNLVETVSPDTGRTRFLYDAAGNLTQKIENAPAAGTSGARITSYSYDGLNRLLSIDLPNDPDWTFTYDTDAAKNQKGRLAQISNGVVTTQLEYTQRGDVAIERTTLDGVSYSVEYAYDASGNRTRTTAPSGIAGESAFAGLRPASLSILAAPRVEILRDIEWYPFGPRKAALFPPADATEANTVRSRREINLRGQVTEVLVERLDVTPPVPLVHRRYDHRYDGGAPGPSDPGPNLDQVTDLLDPTKSRFFFYDALDRLHKATDLAGTVVHEYTYDAVGNRASQSSAGASTGYVYESGTNRLDAATGAEARDYAHDAYGNRIYDGPVNEGVPPSLFYDDSNRLVQVKDPAGGFATLATYTYDGFGRRIKKVAGEGTTLFFYDTAGHLILEVDKRPTADASRTYVYLEDELVGLVERQKEVGVTAWLPPVAGPIEIDPRLALWFVVGAAALGVGLATRRASPGLATAGSGAALFLLCAGASPTPRITWVHVDPLGTPIAVTNSLGTWDPANPAKVIWRASHEPFGQALPDEDPDGNGALFTLNIRFPGQYADAETGWHYNMHRTYDPNTGRYLEADPLGVLASLNLYEYAGSDPLNSIDALGLESVGRWIGIARGAAREGRRAVGDFGFRDSFTGGVTNRGLAEDAAAASGLSQFGGPGNAFRGAGPANAYLHCIWACLNTRSIDSLTATLIGRNHEDAGDRRGQSPAERAMDDLNNAAGRDCAAGKLDCATECWRRLREGRLFDLGGVPLGAPEGMSPNPPMRLP